jgi:hypothetical protein
MKMIPLVTAVFLFAFTSCKQETEKPAAVEPVSQQENAPAQFNYDNNPLCNDVEDIAAALPKLANYRGYKPTETICLPNRAYGFNYRVKEDAPQKFSIIIYDTQNQYKSFYDHVIEGYNEAQQSKAPNIMRTGKLPGEKGYVVAFNSAEMVGGSYECLIKDRYYLYVLINDDKTAASPDGIEAFIGDYVAKINTAKLK